jgi:hypothetical protein
MGLATFLGDFLQTHLVTLLRGFVDTGQVSRKKPLVIVLAGPVIQGDQKIL